MVTATAPGKIILFGEHAVVYGQPAIAAPVSQVRARADVAPYDGKGILLRAPDLGVEGWLDDAPPDDPLAAPLRYLLAMAPGKADRSFVVTVTSELPIASGLGSGAAIATAVIRAAGQYLGLEAELTPEVISALVYEVEKLHHGTPSGIDNTVIAFEQPVYFRRQTPENLIEPFAIGRPLTLLIADTGVRSNTRDVVGDVRRQWQADPQTFNAIFEACGILADRARVAIADGDLALVGQLMNANQRELERMTVSSPELERLVGAALQAGATGAKLSGGGRGGNMLALVEPGIVAQVQRALDRAGAVRVLRTTIG